ncbi:protein FAM111A-like [Fundulus heteroclitus]|uniref:protein FAM111A-like n=1 Tax=Fundulus heteroclitus TaxID=8078 RepID=UPI00165ADC54|nr:protein FAM111A-like [Fundulus heteroclitus]
MAPKKRKAEENQPDIRGFFNKINRRVKAVKTEEAGTSETPKQTPLKVKHEKGNDSPVSHSHRFTVKFKATDRKEYTIDCDQPRSVLEAIKCSLDTTDKMIKCADENIIIQLGKKDRDSVVPTHFPCSCVGDGESLIILYSKMEKIEVVQEQHDKTIHPREEYSVFYIDTVGGLNTKTKDLFRSKMIKQFKYLCVYGEKGMTVEEALKRDGRFIDHLGEFTLSDNDNPDRLTVRTQKVDSLHQKAFKICLPLNKQVGIEKPKHSILDVARRSGSSVKKAIEQAGSSVNNEEIYELLRQQFPDLKRWMESRFPGDSYQQALNLRKEEFGKIQQSFCEAHRIQKLLKMGKSVCKVIVSNVSQGTGFVLFDRFILTNAHLFKGCVLENTLGDHINVSALFYYDDPEPETNFFFFSAEKIFVDIDDELDYAILELKPEGQRFNPKTKSENVKVPPGLLNKFGPLPRNGEACLIGYPAGGVKKIDPTCIIEPEDRGQAVNDHLAKYKGLMITLQSISVELKNRGIDDIMMGGEKAEKVATYHTFMYHGASGSPVFDAHGQIFGLHTAGYCYGLPQMEERVIEYAHPLLAVFEKFVINLKKIKNDEMLQKLKEAVADNKHLKQILQIELMEVD